MTDMKARAAPVVTTPAERRWLLGLPTWIRASAAETNGALHLIDQVIPAGFETTAGLSRCWFPTGNDGACPERWQSPQKNPQPANKTLIFTPDWRAGSRLPGSSRRIAHPAALA